MTFYTVLFTPSYLHPPLMCSGTPMHSCAHPKSTAALRFFFMKTLKRHQFREFQPLAECLARGVKTSNVFYMSALLSWATDILEGPGWCEH
jgi:hypothetical protein